MKKLIKEIDKKVNETAIKTYCKFKALSCNKRGAIGSEEIIGIAAVLIAAAFVLIPGLRNFSDNIVTAMNNWWTNTISSRIFPTL